jgi:phospholipid/cholesterol/gamma-HCH transport system substrate-binding protein
MPSATKVSWAQLRVGLTALIALVLIGILIYFLTGTSNPFSRDVAVYTYLGDAAAVAVGSPVRINGINAGSVKNVVLTDSQDPARSVRIEMGIEEVMLKHIPVDSTVAISAENLLGAKFINIKKGTSREVIKAGATLPALQSREIFEIMDSFFPLLTSAQAILARIDNVVSMIESGKGNVGKLLVDESLYARLDIILSEFQKTSKAVNSGEGTIGKLLYDQELYNEIRQPIQRIDRIMAEVEAGKGTAGKLLKDPAIYDEVQKNLVIMRTLLSELQAGKGTAGKLLKTDEMHNEIAGVIKRIDVTMDKINSGQGTLGQLLVNPALYESLNGTTREMNGLLKDFRANPKKFLSIKLGLF